MSARTALAVIALLLATPSLAQATITMRGFVVDRVRFCSFVRNLSTPERLYYIVALGITRYERAQIRVACNIK